MEIAIIGSGSWGCAIASVLADKGNEVCLGLILKRKATH